MTRAALLIVWGWIVLWSVISGRLDLLLRGVFHGLVGASGVALILAGVVLLIRRRGRRERLPWPWWYRFAPALMPSSPWDLRHRSLPVHCWRFSF